jgi:hypothetical protein
MPKNWFRPLIPHAIAVVVFLLIAVIYCKPAFDHKALSQSDVSQWKATAQNSFQYKETHGHFPLWTEGVFGGMPAYQIAMESGLPEPQGIVNNMLMLGLKKPASFFFLACICFYFLSQVLRVNPYAGIAGALAYAYASYNAVIIYVGHDTKMLAIALMPFFIGSLLLIYEKTYWWGTALLALSTSIFVAVNHPQIVYYALIIVAFLTAAYVIRWVREKDVRHLLIAGSLTVFGGLTGVLCNSIITFTTLDYAKASIRGGSELANGSGQVTRTGLSQDYAFSYSMYKTEPFELLVPKIYGGSGDWSAEISEDKSKAIAALQEMPPELGRQLQQEQFLDFYWGGIGSTAGPVYAGAIICFLSLWGFFILDGKHKWWILGACVLGIVMSWGSYFAGFNGFLLKVLPGYDKFRAPSMTLVIPNFLLCVLATLSLQKLFVMAASERAAFWEKYKKGLYLTAGVFVVLLLIYFSLDFTTDRERQLLKSVSAQGGQVSEYIHHFVQGLRDDRQSLFLGSLLRSLLFIAGAAVIAALAIKGKLHSLVMLVLIGALSLIDLIGIDLQYLNNDRYQDQEDAQAAATPSAADQAIMQDKGYYRVFDLRMGVRNITNNASTCLFHLSLGGYSPAKLSIYQDLIEHQLYQFPNCQPVLNMLNAKYTIQPGQAGRDSAVMNPGALGAAWFVRSVKFAPIAPGVMDALTGLDTRDTAVVFDADRSRVQYDTLAGPAMSVPDRMDPIKAAAGDSIQLVKNDNDEMEYRSASSGKRFAVFSEIYYDRGWKAYIDGAETPIIRTNYALRGLSVPAGTHTIRFVFHPASYYTGQKVQAVASSIMVLLLLGAVVVEARKRKNRLE